MRRARALVESVRYAVAIAVDRATAAVDRRPGRRIGALIRTVGNAVLVGICGATDRVYTGAGRRRRAFVDPVVYAVAVRVGRTAARVDLRAFDRIWARVEAVVDLVAVGIAGTSARVHDGARRCAWARVATVGDAVAVCVPERAGADEHRQARRSHDVPCPIRAREAGLGRIDRAALEAQRQSLADEDPVADRAMHGIVGEAVGGGVVEGETRVGAKGGEEVAGARQSYDQA